MAWSRLMLLLFAFVPLASNAQTPPIIEGPVYTVTYAEVLPGAVKEGISVLRQYREAVRKEAGNLRSETAQESGRATRFVLLAIWSDQKAFDAQAKAASAAQLRENFRSVQAAPLDERVHSGFWNGTTDTLRIGAVIVASHVDVPPPFRETLEPMLKQLAEASRGDSGNLGFQVQQQANRPNHFSVVEVWSDARAYEAHVRAPHTRAFREKLGPMLGALYDERLYRLID